jgi:hypothetical protein
MFTFISPMTIIRDWQCMYPLKKPEWQENYIIWYVTNHRKKSSLPSDHPYRADTDVVTPSMKM